jgi:HK97 family phage major capsid protein
MEPAEIKKQLDEGFAGVKTHVDTKVDGISSEVKTLSERLEKIEKSPIITAPNLNFKFEKNYKGYDMEEQGGILEDLAARSKNPKRFKTFSNPEKMYSFKKWMIDALKAMRGDMKTAMELKAAMAEGTDSLGGYLVPIEYQWDLVLLARDISFLLQQATVLTMSEMSLKLPAEASLVSVNWIDEAGAITASDPTMGQVVLTAKKLAGLTTAMSNELLADSAIDIVSMLSKQFSYAIGMELDNQALNGTGAPVSGVLTAAAGYSAVLGSGSTSFSAVTFDACRSAVRKLASADAAVASWVYSKDVGYYLDTIKDTLGRPIYREPAGDRPAALYNRGIFESAKAPAESASGTGKGFMVLGNWANFYVGRRRGDMTIDVDPYGSFANDGTRFRVVTRWGLAMARSTAFCRIVTA